MPSLRDVTHEMFRSLGLTTMFGNPGSTEETMLAQWPEDFDYVLGLHEGAVVSMADGWSQVTGRPVLVSLHTAPGVGNAMGAIVTARWSGAPLVITAGQQVRSMITARHWLVNEDATTLPRPAVKWSFEPPEPSEVPHALARAATLARTAPTGPVFVSLPMDDWWSDVPAGPAADVATRTIAGRAAPEPGAIGALAARIDGAERPALVLGAAVDRTGGWDDAVALAERAGLEVWTAPTCGRGVFPEDSPWFRGFAKFGAAHLAEQMAGYDLLVVVGAPVFTTYPYEDHRLVEPSTEVVMVHDDPDAIARAPLGDAVLGDPQMALAALSERVAASDRQAPQPRQRESVPPQSEDRPTAGQLYAALAEVIGPEVRKVNEAPSSLAAYHGQIRNTRSGGFLTTPSGGLGYGLAAAVGAAIAGPDRPTLAIVGDGSLQYTLQALWTAARRDVPLVVVVVANAEYGILKAYADFSDTDAVPGLDVPGLDAVKLAEGYGVTARRTRSAEEAAALVAEGLASGSPLLVEVSITPEIPDLL